MLRVFRVKFIILSTFLAATRNRHTHTQTLDVNRYAVATWQQHTAREIETETRGASMSNFLSAPLTFETKKSKSHRKLFSKFFGRKNVLDFFLVLVSLSSNKTASK